MNCKENEMKRLLIALFVLVILIGSSVFYYINKEKADLEENKINYFTCNANQYYAERIPENPLFSIILSTYNRAEYLPRAICSVLAQHYNNFEFIIIDDGSSDDTAKVIKKYAQKDKRIRYVKNEKNGGLVYSLNKGLGLAKGKYITRLDDDDYLFPEFFVEYAKHIDEYPEVVLFHSLPVSVNDSGETSERLANVYKSLNDIDVFSVNSIPNIGATLRKDFLMENNLTYLSNYKAAEDYKLIADILMHGGKTHGIDKILTGYRIHQTNGKQYEINRQISSQRIQNQLIKFFSTGPSYDLCQVFKNMNETIYTVFTEDQLNYALKKYCR